MLKRIAGIAFILICTSAAWMILASSVWSRTNDSSEKLTPDMASIWGTPQVQDQPLAFYHAAAPAVPAKTLVFLRAESSHIDVKLDLEHRKKGLLWYSVYLVRFDGLYSFRNDSNVAQEVTFELPFPAKEAVYEGVTLEINGQPRTFRADNASACVFAAVRPGELVAFRAVYQSQGMESWRYKLGDDLTQTRNFTLHLITNPHISPVVGKRPDFMA